MDLITNSNQDNLNQNGVKTYGIRKSTLIWNRKSQKPLGLERFQKIIEKKYNKHFDSYWDFHKWSIENFQTLWKEMWNFFDFVTSKPYNQVHDSQVVNNPLGIVTWPPSETKLMDTHELPAAKM
ncbi:hypothetical protein NPIL_342201 [Nephila pilipes]|uniref:Uncharacterized protein n=1 Tax=Nephila pilipes TaxID=299642 RepID=A0A8X6N768_NEPPI|nr:hypothetical protein NPIL_342201 [Nephila pilipes]